MKGLAVGGAADHVHILISLPGTLSLAKALQLLKGNSSKWVPEYLFPSVKTLGYWRVSSQSTITSRPGYV